MEFENLQFLKEIMDIELERRTVEHVFLLEEEVHDGDLFLLMRLDGIDPIVMFGTGSRAAHCVVAMRFDGILHLVEVQHSVFWPTIGVQKTPFTQWMRQAEEADFNVVHLKMREEIRDKWDHYAASEFFWQLEGNEYGFPTFLYGWIDTLYDNFPSILHHELVPIVF